MGGCKLARGYLNRPDLTAAKFVDDPFHSGGMLIPFSRHLLAKCCRVHCLGRCEWPYIG